MHESMHVGLVLAARHADVASKHVMLVHVKVMQQLAGADSCHSHIRLFAALLRLTQLGSIQGGSRRSIQRLPSHSRG
jgi:hypothetical protein